MELIKIQTIGCDYKMLTLYIDKCKSKNLVPTMAGFYNLAKMTMKWN